MEQPKLATHTTFSPCFADMMSGHAPHVRLAPLVERSDAPLRTLQRRADTLRNTTKLIMRPPRRIARTTTFPACTHLA